MQKIFTTNIEKDTLENMCFRKVIQTNKNQQLVLMSLKPGEDIPMEVHPNDDQFIRIEKGRGRVVIGKDGEQKKESDLGDGSIVMIPAGTYHQIINVSKTDNLKLYTLYSPPDHKPGIINITKPNKDEGEEEKYTHIDPKVCISNQLTQKAGFSKTYERKYMKYKNKYLALKNIANNNYLL